MFLKLKEKNVDVFIITNSSHAYSNQKNMLELIKLIIPNFKPENLIHSGKFNQDYPFKKALVFKNSKQYKDIINNLDKSTVRNLEEQPNEINRIPNLKIDDLEGGKKSRKSRKSKKSRKSRKSRKSKKSRKSRKFRKSRKTRKIKM